MSELTFDILRDAINSLPKPPVKKVMYVSKDGFAALEKEVLQLPGINQSTVSQIIEKRKMVIDGIEIWEGWFLPIVFKYPCCDLKTRQESFVEERVDAVVMPKTDRSLHSLTIVPDGIKIL